MYVCMTYAQMFLILQAPDDNSDVKILPNHLYDEEKEHEGKTEYDELKVQVQYFFLWIKI